MTHLRVVDPKTRLVPVPTALTDDELGALQYVAKMIPPIAEALSELRQGVEVRNPVLAAAACRRFSSLGELLRDKAAELEKARP